MLSERRYPVFAYDSDSMFLFECIFSECSFHSKAITVESAGGLAMVVTQTRPSSAALDTDVEDLVVEMLTDGTKRRVNIPAFYIAGKHGRMFRDHYERFMRSSKYQNYDDFDASEDILVDIPLNLTLTPLHRANLPPWDLW